MSRENYIQFDFFITDRGHQDILIAELSVIGFGGFEEKTDRLSAFICEKDLEESEFASVIYRHSDFSFTRKVLENRNWNEDWERSFNPVIIDDFAGIRAAFHLPLKGVSYDLIVTPKMSFGTGHHATTFLMINRMREIDFKGKHVLDFGSGTGVLAILAEKMGATDILAVDHDEWSMENMEENIKANGCNYITLRKAGEVSGTGEFDVILANINLNVIVSNLAAIRNAGKSGCIVLFSGFLKVDEALVRSALMEFSFSPPEQTQKGDWICLESSIK